MFFTATKRSFLFFEMDSGSDQIPSCSFSLAVSVGGVRFDKRMLNINNGNNLKRPVIDKRAKYRRVGEV